MTSILKVDNIKDSANNAAMSISSGVVTFVKPPVGVNNPNFSAYPSAGSSLSGSTFHIMPFNTEEFDSDGKFNTSTYKFTPTIAGFYSVSWHICFPIGNGAYVATRLMKNTATFKFGQNGGGVSNITRITGGTCIVQLSTTDSIHVEAYHGAGTTTFPVAANLGAGSTIQTSNGFSAFKLGA